MNALSFQALNCNSIVRTDTQKTLSSPFLSLLKKTNDICLFSDVRVSDERFSFLSDKLSLSDVIGIKKTRFFSTIQPELKTGGVAIYIPQCYDGIINISYVSRDTSVIPRYISLIAEVVGGPNILITSFYGSPGKTGEKSKVLRRLYNHLYEVTRKFGISIMIMGADFNLPLNLLQEGGGDKKILSKIVNDFCLQDAFTTCPPLLNKRDFTRLRKQDQDATWDKNGFTYYPKILGNKPSRLDGILFSSSLESNMVEKSFCLSQGNAYSDHKAVHFYFSWSFSGIPEGEAKPTFFFHNSLLEERSFRRKIKKEVADTILEHYSKMGGILSYECTKGIPLDCLESLIFDRAKNDHSCFSAIDILYNMFHRIAKLQNIFLKNRTSAEKTREKLIIQKISKLENLQKLSRSDQRALIAANKELEDNQKRRIKRQAIDSNIDYEIHGEEGSRCFLRSKVARRSKAFVRIFEKPNGEIIHDSFEIEKQFFEHYKDILEAPDPYCQQAFYEFVNPFICKFGKISVEDRVSFQSPISIQELNHAIRKINSNSCPGPDGLTGRLLRFIYNICPRLFCHAINNELFAGKCEGKEIMLRRLIFIPKPTDKITIKRYRPISLLSSFYKLGDSCAVNRLVSGLQNAKIFPPYMSAYRPGFSTIDSILSLQTFIDNANHTGRKLVILNWDVSQAFDRCSRLMVQEVLRILGFGEVLISYIANLPIGALARVCINLAESRFPNLFASNGCAQGQSSSAQKFCLAMYVILLRLDMQDISSFKIELGVKRKMSLLESYTNYLWKCDKDGNNEGEKINSRFKEMAQKRWKLLSRGEKENLKPKIKQYQFYQRTIKELSDISALLSYSDDGHLFLEYRSIDDILNVMKIFNDFGVFSGLKINPDKTRLVTLNFSLSPTEINCLTERGFDQNMISDGNIMFRFLGCDICPYFLKAGAINRLESLCTELEKIAAAFDHNTTLKGRRVVCQSLLLSRLQAALTAFDLSEKDLRKIQAIIDKFCHKKKISAGKSKYLSFSNGGIQIPKYFEKFLVARACLLKGLFTKITENQTLPTWGCVLIEGLRFIGFESPTLLFRSMGQADIKLIIKCFNEMGLLSLASLFQSVEILNNLLEQKRSDQKRKKNQGAKSPQQCEGLTCLSFKESTDEQILNKRNLGFRDKFGLFRDSPDPPSDFRSLSLIGSIYDQTLLKRNQQSLYGIWKDINEEAGGGIPAFEFSARNSKEMARWILNNAASPICLLNEKNQAAPSNRILPIINQSKRSEHIFNALVSQAQSFCSLMAKEVGPGSPIYKPNIFVSWISACTKQNNGKSLYYQVLNAKFGEIESTAIKKLKRAGIPGKIDNMRIGRGLARGIKTFNSAKTERATTELTLAAMRSERDICRIRGRPQRPCTICGCYEIYDDLSVLDHSAQRGFYRHIFLECTPAAYLRQYMRVMSVRIFGFKLELSLAGIMLNEIPMEQFKRTNENSRKAWFAVLNCYKTALFSIYYMRPNILTAELILCKINQNLSIVRKIAQKRGSNILNNICLPTVSFFNIISLPRVHRRVMEDFSEFRNEDRIFRRNVYLNENRYGDQLNTNIPKRKKIKNAKPFSTQKRQILISEAFAKIQNNPCTKSGSLELVAKYQCVSKLK